MTCTCGARAPHFSIVEDGLVEARPTYDLNCPVHGLEALIFEVRYPDEEEGSITGS